MKSLVSGLALALAFTLVPATGTVAAATASPDTATPAAAQPEVLDSAFGLFSLGGDGSPPFKPAAVVPLVEGQAYGWIIKLRTDSKQVRWREEFTLPAAPEAWNGATEAGVKHTLSADSRVSVMERAVEPSGGLIFNSWSVAKGDPAGKYRIRVFVEGRLAASFEFDVR